MKYRLTFSAFALLGAFLPHGSSGLKSFSYPAPPLYGGVALLIGFFTIALALLRRPCVPASGRILSPYDK